MNAGGPGVVAPPPKHPIDRGWAWMICLGAFAVNFFVNGGLRSTGIIFIELVIQYQADQSLTSLTVAAMAGGFAIFSAIGSAVGAVKTMRTACLIGSVLMFLGMFLTYFASNVYAAIVCLGMMSGIGYGFAFGPSMIMVGQYFVKRRSLANGLAAAGGSVGTLVLPLFIRSASQEYGFQGMILIYAGIILHAIPASMLLRPVSFYSRPPPVPSPATATPAAAAAAAKTENGCRDVNDNDPIYAAGEKTKKKMTMTREKRYELVGSKVIAVPIGASMESLPVDEPIVYGENEAGQPVALPPPQITVGMVVRMFCQRICDRDLLRSWPFLLFVAGLTFGQGGYISNCMFIPPYAFEVWQRKDLAAMLIVVLGMADLVGRVGGGWFADFGLIRKPFLVGFCFVACGVATMIIPFFPYFVAVVVYIVVLGLLGGMYLALMFVIVAELVSPVKTPPALGLATLCMGLALIPMLPVLTAIAKATGTFSSAIRLSGLLLLLGGVSFYLIPLMYLLQAKRLAAQQQQQLLQQTSAAKTKQQQVA